MSRIGARKTLVLWFVLAATLTAAAQFATHTASQHRANRSASPASRRATSISPQVFGGSNSPVTNIRFLGSTQLSLGARIALAQPVKGDFNGDGKLDVAVAAEDFSTNRFYIAMFAGNGDGTFQSAVYTLLGATLPVNSSLIAGVTTSSGRTDLVVLYISSVAVYTANSDGTFTQGNSYSVSDSSAPIEGLLVDVNNDTKLDLVLVAGGSVHEFLGNGNGTFQADQTTALGNGAANLRYAMFADLNGDGMLDVVDIQAGEIDVYLASANSVAPTAIPSGDAMTTSALSVGNSYPTFATYLSPDSYSSFAEGTLADVNGDGKPDILVADYRLNQVMVYLNHGDGSFAAGVPYTTGYDSYPGSVGAADVNGDGKVDLIAANDDSADITILPGNGDGTFGAPLTGYAAMDWPWDLPVIGDFNRDGKLDVIVSGEYNYLTYLQGYGDGTFRAAHTNYSPVSMNADPAHPTDWAWGWDIAVGDLNADGKLDVVVGDCCNNVAGLVVFLGKGDGSFQPAARYGTGGGLQYVRLADINGDGKLDLVASDDLNKNISVFLNTGNGTFAATPITYDVSSMGIPEDMAIGDFNGDSKPDVATVMGASVVVLLNNGSGGLKTPVEYSLSTSGHGLRVADLNHDGKLDLIVAETSATVGVLLGNGDGTFQAASELTFIGGSPQDLTVGDFNGDGKLDVAVVVRNSPPSNDAVLEQPLNVAALLLNGDYIAIALGNGDGTFQSAMAIYATLRDQTSRTGEAYALGIQTADIDGDGKLDLVWSNSEYNAVALAYGKGDGTFYDPVETAVGGYPSLIALGDFNNDGGVDVVTANDDMGGAFSLALNAGGDRLTLTQASSGSTTTLTAHVAPTVRGVTAVPSGTVTFRTGTTTLGTATLNAGANASLNVSSASISSNTVVAAYPGDINFLPAVGAILGDYSVSLSRNTGAVSAGQPATFTVTVLPQGGFTSTVTFACTGTVPSSLTCTFNPATVTPSGGAATTTLTVSANSKYAGMRGGSAHPALAIWLGLLGLTGAGIVVLPAHRRLRLLLCLVLVLGALGFLSGCGGGFPQPVAGGTYHLTVTGTSGSISHSTTLTVTLQ